MINCISIIKDILLGITSAIVSGLHFLTPRILSIGGLPLSSRAVLGSPWSSRQKANRLAENPKAWSNSCWTVEVKLWKQHCILRTGSYGSENDNVIPWQNPIRAWWLKDRCLYDRRLVCPERLLVGNVLHRQLFQLVHLKIQDDKIIVQTFDFLLTNRVFALGSVHGRNIENEISIADSFWRAIFRWIFSASPPIWVTSFARF